jgi:CheY-like chemotaxis protein
MTKIGGALSSDGGQGEPSKAPRSLRIIVADDDRDTVLTLMMVLRHEGHDVKGFYNGAEVMKAVSEFQPDALIVDISMPGLSGYEISRRIAERRGPKPLMIGISGIYKKAPDALIARAVGIDHYLTKPYEPSAVLRLLAPLRSPQLPDS